MVVIGDHPKDALMGDKLPKDSRQLKLGFANFLNPDIETVKEDFKNYDVLQLGDGSFEWINEIITKIPSKKK